MLRPLTKLKSKQKELTKARQQIAKSRKGAKDPQLSWLQWQEPRQNQTGDQEKKAETICKRHIKTKIKPGTFSPGKFL